MPNLFENAAQSIQLGVEDYQAKAGKHGSSMSCCQTRTQYAWPWTAPSTGRLPESAAGPNDTAPNGMQLASHDKKAALAAKARGKTPGQFVCLALFSIIE